MKYYAKRQLARRAGVSYSTFYRYLKSRRDDLARMGISPCAQKLPPKAVRLLADDYCLDLPDDD
jgi:AcrR family transcriptional regulator